MLWLVGYDGHCVFYATPPPHLRAVRALCQTESVIRKGYASENPNETLQKFTRLASRVSSPSPSWKNPALSTEEFLLESPQSSPLTLDVFVSVPSGEHHCPSKRNANIIRYNANTFNNNVNTTSNSVSIRGKRSAKTTTKVSGDNYEAQCSDLQGTLTMRNFCEHECRWPIRDTEHEDYLPPRAIDSRVHHPHANVWCKECHCDEQYCNRYHKPHHDRP